MLKIETNDVIILSPGEKFSDFFSITYKNNKLKIISNKLNADKNENITIRKVFFFISIYSFKYIMIVHSIINPI